MLGSDDDELLLSTLELGSDPKRKKRSKKKNAPRSNSVINPASSTAAIVAPSRDTPVPQDRKATIACYLCGQLIQSNSAALCAVCLSQQVDLAERLSLTGLTLTTCKDCSRWRKREGLWIPADLESPELLQLCLKSISGLDRVKLVNARFVWTEPHSRRIRVQLLVQDEALRGVSVRQEVTAEFVVRTQQCKDCARSYTDHTWLAALQLRQPSAVRDRRTLLFVEQAILHHQAATAVTGMQEHPQGLDFFFQHRTDAQKLLEFIQALVPLRSKTSQRLVSHDAKSNSATIKYTISAEVVPISRGDLVILPLALCRKLGGFEGGQRCLLCIRVGQSLTLLDPCSQSTRQVSAKLYFNPKYEFNAFLSRTALVEFFVLDIVACELGKDRDGSGGPGVAATGAEVQCVRSSELGETSSVVVDCFCYFGRSLRPGDCVLGYDLRSLNSDDLEELRRDRVALPSVVLVKRKNIKGPKRRKPVKRLVAEHNDATKALPGQGDSLLAPSTGEQRAARRILDDTEEFLADRDADELMHLTLSQAEQAQVSR